MTATPVPATLADAITASLERFCAAWAGNDGAAVAAFYTEGGSLINPFGQRADGRGAIAAMYSEYFTGLLRGTSTTIVLNRARSVAPDHAFIDAEQPLTAPDGSVVMVVQLAALLRREGENWQFVDARPSTAAQAPA